MSLTAGLSPVVSDLDGLVEDLVEARQRAASAFAAEMFFFERVVRLVERREQERAARTERVTTRSSQLGMREVFAEVAAALRMSEWQVARKVNLAWSLTNEFYETLCDASCGQISPDHAMLIAETGAVIVDEAVRRQFEAVARDMAGEMTPGQLKPALSGLVQRLDPEGTEERVREAVLRRKVTVRELEPGLARITADLPTAQGVGIVDRLRAMATEQLDQNEADKAQAQAQAQAHALAEAQAQAARKSGAEAAGACGAAGAASSDGAGTCGAAGAAGSDGPGTCGAADAAGSDGAGTRGAADADAGAGAPVFDERTRSQVMADIFCDLLLTSATDGHGSTPERRGAINSITATVQVTVPATALAGATVGGAAVAGFGPIDSDTARHLAGVAPAWVRVFTDPCSGVPIMVDRYRPSKKQKLFLQSRDRRCRFPGCRRPARECDIDHTVPYAEDGPTCLCNLEHFCARHHTLKHETDWSVEQVGGGVLRFTAPTRRVHFTRPPGTVRFEPVGLIEPDAPHPHEGDTAVPTVVDGDPAPY